MLAGLLAACTFEGPSRDHPGGHDGPDYPADPSVDASGAEPQDATTEPQPVASECNPSDDTLRLCVDFEAPDPYASKAAVAQSIQTQNVALDARATGQAGVVGQASRMLVAESSTLDVETLTASAWFQPHRIGTNQYLLENHGQYAIRYDFEGDVQCMINAVDTSHGGPAIPPSTTSWTHVACTFDRRQLRIYINGDLDGCMDYSSSLNRNGDHGIAIGANNGPSGLSDRFGGALDAVRVHARALTPAEICAMAGRTGCRDTCPGE